MAKSPSRSFHEKADLVNWDRSKASVRERHKPEVIHFHEKRYLDKCNQPDDGKPAVRNWRLSVAGRRSDAPDTWAVPHSAPPHLSDAGTILPNTGRTHNSQANNYPQNSNNRPLA